MEPWANAATTWYGKRFADRQTDRQTGERSRKILRGHGFHSFREEREILLP